jgi:transcriptional regulator with XRE-family HTH domain
VQHQRQHELLPLDQLARELGVHQRTLRAAARIGRLQVQFSIRSVFGRPIRLATRAAGQAFLRTHYRHYGRKGLDVPPLPSVPNDYDKRLKNLRHRLGLTQVALARHIGAANRAVVYQWESRQRRPSPVFWQRVEALGRASLDVRPARISPKGPAPRSNRPPAGYEDHAAHRQPFATYSQGGASDSGGVAPTDVRVTHILRSRRRERG